ncbi:DUF6894 family protein [Microvirga massiliensis]|uniref:DUF6894 family protein n=1 Tax=Microvirga massiliensis TaxID=1033741 RepID=UPI00065FE626
MTRYFFNIQSSSDCVEDNHGEEGALLQAAGTRAVESARELLPDLRDSRHAAQVFAFEIEDEHGRLYQRIPFTLAGTISPNTGAGQVH